MPSEVILPRVDMDMATGKIAKWFVEPNSVVTKGQPLFEIETDKAAMEIEAPATGTIRDLAAASGADIPVGSVVAWIFAEGEAAAPKPAASSAPAAAAPVDAARLKAEDERFDSALPPPKSETPGADAQITPAGGDPDRPRATPMARRLARAKSVDLALVTGSGPRGRIQARDIDAAASAKPSPVGETRAPAAKAPAIAAEPVASTPAGTMGAAAAAQAKPAASTPLNLVQLRKGEGRATLLIHGFGADANTWRPYLSGRSSGRPVLALDLPGHGGSGLAALSSFADLVDAVEAGLIAADLSAVDLVAHSLGGAVAAAVAARGSLDIRSLLLLAPAGLGPQINGAFVSGFLGASSEASLTPWMHELVTDPATISPAFVRATLAARQGTDLVARQRQVADAVFPDGTQAFTIRSDLARLTMPTRIVVGTADKVLPAAYATGLPGLVALHTLPGIGHMPQFEARETVAAIAAQMQSAG